VDAAPILSGQHRNVLESGGHFIAEAKGRSGRKEEKKTRINIKKMKRSLPEVELE